jgi:hypothetical protein
MSTTRTRSGDWNCQRTDPLAVRMQDRRRGPARIATHQVDLSRDVLAKPLAALLGEPDGLGPAFKLGINRCGDYVAGCLECFDYVVV